MEAAAENRDEDGEEWSVAYVTVAATNATSQESQSSKLTK